MMTQPSPSTSPAAYAFAASFNIPTPINSLRPNSVVLPFFTARLETEVMGCVSCTCSAARTVLRRVQVYVAGVTTHDAEELRLTEIARRKPLGFNPGCEAGLHSLSPKSYRLHVVYRCGILLT